MIFVDGRVATARWNVPISRSVSFLGPGRRSEKKKRSSGGGTTPEMKIQQANIGKTQGFNHHKIIKFCFQGENMYKLDIDGIQTIKRRDLYQQLLLVGFNCRTWI